MKSPLIIANIATLFGQTLSRAIMLSIRFVKNHHHF